MKKFYDKMFKNTLSVVLTVIVCSLAIIIVAYAATTIGDNITTAGNLTVTGRSTTTSATTTNYLYVGHDITELSFSKPIICILPVGIP